MTTSVIIRCFNEERHIGRLLFGLTQQSKPPDEIVVVDSGSTDATLNIASRFPVRIVSIRPEEFSFGRALNIGCRAATGDVLIFASAHVYPVLDNWLAELVAPLVNEHTSLAYGRQVGDHRTKYSERRLLCKLFPTRSVARQVHPFCNNANAAIRRSVWERQPYDEDLTGLEDLDWAQRAMQAGHKIAYVAEAAVVHVHEETTAQIVNRYRREAIAHQRIFPDQRMGVLDALRLAAGSITSDYYHAAREGVLAGHLLGIPVFRGAQFWGTYRGFHQRGPATEALRRHFYYPNGLRSDGAGGDMTTGGHAIMYDELPQRGAK